MTEFEIVGEIKDIETIATARGVYIRPYLKGNPMSDFVICINNDRNPASLILGKVYRTLADAEAETHKMLRVIDEDKSEPDGYLYPASMFVPIELPEVARLALTAAGA